MNLTAKKLIDYKNKQGEVWYKGWRLVNVDTGKAVGMMAYNSYHETQFNVQIYSPVHEDLGPVGCKAFATGLEALIWAREQIEQLQEPTVADYEAAIHKVRDYRYQDSVSDDFAYSNGKIDRWDRIERQLKDRMHGLTPSAI